MFRRSPVCWTMPVTTSPTRSMYSSYIISRSASRMRCRITCFAVWAAMRPKFSGVTSSRLIIARRAPPTSRSRGRRRRAACGSSRPSPPRSARGRRARARAPRRAGGPRGPRGSSIANTRKSPWSSSSTVACRDAPGVFLYAASSASSRAATSVPALDSLLALDLANGVNDLLAHRLDPFIDQIGPHDLVVRDVHRLRRRSAIWTDRSPAETTVPRARPVVGLQAHVAADGALEVVSRAQRPLEARVRRPRRSSGRGTGAAPRSRARRARGRRLAGGRRRRRSAPCP